MKTPLLRVVVWLVWAYCVLYFRLLGVRLSWDRAGHCLILDAHRYYLRDAAALVVRPHTPLRTAMSAAAYLWPSHNH